MRSVELHTKAIAFVLVVVAIIAAFLVVSARNQERTGKAVPFIVASSVNISHDFSACSMRFVNEGNATDTTRSVLIFYIPAGSQDTVVRNANPAPSITIPPKGMADWNCTSSFAGSPPGVNGQAVHVVISAIVSRERDSVGYFT